MNMKPSCEPCTNALFHPQIPRRSQIEGLETATEDMAVPFKVPEENDSAIRTKNGTWRTFFDAARREHMFV
jgi:hypothetical protein